MTLKRYFFMSIGIQLSGILKKTYHTSHFLCFLLAAVFCLAGCTGSSDSGTDGIAADTTSPTISITLPTSGDSFITADATLYVRMTTSDDRGVTGISCTTDTGYGGQATPVTGYVDLWEATIPMVIGINHIAATARDAAGNTVQDTLTVTYTSQTYALSGTIAAADNVAVDSDVNDENETYLANDSLLDAQEIPIPVTIGGFVNVAGTGEPTGRSYVSGDPDDYFRVTLAENNEITLVIGEYETADLDLYLYDNAGDLADASIGTDNIEAITVQGNGTYYIQVSAYEGASNYTLSVGSVETEQASAAMAKGALSPLKLTDTFVPGQVILEFKPEAGIQTGVRKGPGEKIQALGLTMVSRGNSNMALAELPPGKRAGFFRAMGLSEVKDQSPKPATALSEKLETLRMIKALRHHDGLSYAEPNFIVHTSETPDDSLYYTQWNLPMIQMPDAWEVTKGSSQVVVAIVDTGILMNHPDLSGRLTDDGYDFISSTEISLDGDGMDSDPNDPGDLRYNTYSSFHGTHCAGIVAAAANNAKGVAGVAPETKIMPVRVLGKGGSGTVYDVLEGVKYAAGLTNDSGRLPDNPADIINLSLGGTTYLYSAQSVYTQVRNKGIIVVAAAGNSNTTIPDYPASYDGVVSVSAVDITGDRAAYSNFGSKVDVAAPGGDGTTDLNRDGYLDGVMSTCGDDRSGTVVFNYTPKSGTSMATPHVAGVIALMKALKPDLSPDEFDGYLTSFAIVTDIGMPGRDDEFGYGLIDAAKAVTVAAGGETDVALKITPEAINMGTGLSSTTLTAEKTGNQALTLEITDVSESVDWLEISPDNVDADGLGTYLVHVNRTGLVDGFYSADIIFTTARELAAGGTETAATTARVAMQVNSSVSTTPDSGYHYVLLVTADTLDTVKMVEASAVNGFYTYTFNNVPEGGHYKIFAGTDRDADRGINNYGESFGAYGSIDQPLDIISNSDLSGLDFYSELTVSFTAHQQIMSKAPALLTLP